MHNTIPDTFLTIFPSRHNPHHQNKARKFIMISKTFKQERQITLLLAGLPPEAHLNKAYCFLQVLSSIFGEVSQGSSPHYFS